MQIPLIILGFENLKAKLNKMRRRRRVNGYSDDK